MRDNLAPLPFGVPALDKLLGYPSFESEDLIQCLDVTTSLTIVGEDGTGKSVFALHLAAAYQAMRHHRNEKIRKGEIEQTPADEIRSQPLVLYISSDLRSAGAQRIWQSFYLDEPWRRYVPFISGTETKFRRGIVDDRYRNLVVTLTPCTPEDLPAEIQNQRIAAVSGNEDPSRVIFVDLASRTTGDDWLFVTRLVSTVGLLRQKNNKEAPPNLLIIDSVAGFETLVGEKNSFGETMSRRARIAQLIRAAANSWHTVFVVEEPELGHHHPEEYVTDTVLHLRREGENEKVRRILQIEKSRSRSFASGEHPFEIRDGLGTSTGSWENPDDPRTFRRPEAKAPHHRSDFNSYIQVFPSLTYLSKHLAGKTTAVSARAFLNVTGPPRKNARFGIKYLDNMLATEDIHGRRGLPEGSVTSLIGDEGTLKSSLAEQFLAEGFSYFHEMLNFALSSVSIYLDGAQSDINEVLRGIPKQHPELLERLPNWIRGRVKARLMNWLGAYPTRQRGLSALFVPSNGQLSPLKLLSERELAKAIDNWGRDKKRSSKEGVNAPTRPLAPRWDHELYYTQNSPVVSTEETKLALALSILRISSGLVAPAVYITTHDTSAERIAWQILRSQEQQIRKVLIEHSIPIEEQSVKNDKYWDGMSRLLERFIIVRRIELTDATGPQLWHIIHGCVHESFVLMGTEPSFSEREDAIEFAGHIRFVLNDLRLIRDTYPSANSDPLFLPTVVFRLRRMKITSLLVDSDNGRPDSSPVNVMNGALRSLVDQQIYTWKVPFFGEERVAISVIPPLPGNAAGIIRELKYRSLDERSARKIDVDPHFSLYMGVEEGKPTTVPLQVVFYAETAAFDEYVASEQGLFSRVFTAARGDDKVIHVEKTHDYEGLRDYCHLSTETRLPFTLVFAVDEFWALTRGASLRDEALYLYTPVQDEEAESRDSNYIDSFGLFQRTRQAGPAITCRAETFKQLCTDRRNVATRYCYDSLLPRRTQVLTVKPSAEPLRLDRIPFMWDFGFLLCNEQQWENAKDVKLPKFDKSVGDVRDELRGKQSSRRQRGQSRPFPRRRDKSRAEQQRNSVVSWRLFFEACSVVAQVESRRTEKETMVFDLATATPESLSCCLFEIWLSEIAADAIRLAESPSNTLASEWAKRAFHDLDLISRGNRWSCAIKEPLFLQDMLGDTSATVKERYEDAKKHFEQQSKEPPKDQTAALTDALQKLPRYSLQLYKTWLLLLEVLDFTRYQDPDHAFELRADYEPTLNAAASRHWYKTACATTANLEAFRSKDGAFVPRTPLRLPGHFTIRGDWFLAVARGSRSSTLADRALDLLTSRRANRTRLHLGLGLPTRDVMEGSEIRRMRTRLSVLSRELTLTQLEYGKVLDLGGALAKPEGPHGPTRFVPQFRWAFRSAFSQYDRQSRVVQKWIHRMLTWTVRYRNENRSNWLQSPGFDIYDAINRGDFTSCIALPSFIEFAAGIDVFIADLNAATLVDLPIVRPPVDTQARPAAPRPPTSPEDDSKAVSAGVGRI